MTVYFATDHAGFALKEVLVPYVRDTLGYSVEDCGAYEFVDGDDYPDFISKAAEKVGSDPLNCCAIVLGGSGQGEAMVANRIKNVRATVYYGARPEIITLSKEHNNANILSLGARFLTETEAKEAVKVWLETQFGGDERHARRLQKF